MNIERTKKSLASGAVKAPKGMAIGERIAFIMSYAKNGGGSGG